MHPTLRCFYKNFHFSKLFEEQYQTKLIIRPAPDVPRIWHSSINDVDNVPLAVQITNSELT